MTSARNARVHIWTMATAALGEATVASWAVALDDGERARAARLLFPRRRVAFIAAHALTRAALAGAAGAPPAAFSFAAGVHGKPEAILDGRPAGLVFNLAHTDGVVGVAVAVADGLKLGFDLEPIGRRAPMQVARRCFTESEVAWLEGLPAARRGEGFFRLWTLKEAFIKATGQGLTQDLSQFWFTGDPPVIGFAPDLAESPQDWCFVQRVVHRGCLAAVGLGGQGRGGDAIWHELDPAGFDPTAGLDG